MPRIAEEGKLVLVSFGLMRFLEYAQGRVLGKLQHIPALKAPVSLYPHHAQDRGGHIHGRYKAGSPFCLNRVAGIENDEGHFHVDVVQKMNMPEMQISNYQEGLSAFVLCVTFLYPTRKILP